MSTMKSATTAEERLAELGIHLPAAPTPLGAYVPAVQAGTGHVRSVEDQLQIMLSA